MKVELTEDELFTLKVVTRFFLKTNEKLVEEDMIKELVKHINSITNKLNN
jgi:hypothetical protein